MIASDDYLYEFVRAVDQPLPEMAAYFEAENAYLRGLIGPSSTVLDVGCGLGRSIRALAPSVGTVTGIDYNPRMLQMAKARLQGITNVGFVQQDFFVANFQRKFDLVFASYNLPGAHDIKPEQRSELIGRMKECTAPSGHTVVSFWLPTSQEWLVRYYQSLGAEIIRFEGNVVETTMGTFTRFEMAEVGTLAKRFRGKVIHLTPMFDLLHIRC